MKNFIKIIICIIITVTCFAASYALLAKYHEEHQFDENKIEAKKCFDPSSVLCGAIERKNWDNLALSENFKSKYKTRNDIIPDIKKYTYFSSGYDYINGKECIVIPADKPDSIFDPYGANNVTTNFYFDYKINVNNELDDINLVKIEKVNAMTGNPIENG